MAGHVQDAPQDAAMETESSSSSATANGSPKREPAHTNLPRPKGILKNPSHDGSHGPMNLTWDESNLQEAEENKDSRMKITEPKTPYVRYDAETDTVMDMDKIPNFELGMAEARGSSSGSGGGSGTSSRHSSFTSSRSGSQSLPGSRRGSDTGEKKVDIVLDENLPGGGLSADASDEDESKMTEDERIKHAIFKHQRKSHYGSEGQALLAARQLLEKEDAEAVDDEDEATAEESTLDSSRANGAMANAPNGHS